MSSCALAIGGLDPGGGAGVVADLRSFHAARVFGCAVVAVTTVQSTDGLVASRPVASHLVVAQAEEVMRVQRVAAIKLGALGSVSTVRAVIELVSRAARVPVVLDPVMLPTRGGSRLLAARAARVVRDELIPLATLVIANASEAEVLTGHAVRTVGEARRAACALVDLGATAALVKGGHLTPGKDATDVLALGGGRVIELSARRFDLAPTHGGGCVLASLIAGCLARRPVRATARRIEAAVREARRVHRRALQRSVDVGGAMRVLVP
jgi:hydroxymethylpyrimidine/phosphomethylpyrimidine kinase